MNKKFSLDREAGEVLVVIPARGGSKGIPGKNVCMLAGKPLIAYTIENALKASVVKRVVVSTDDPEISAVSIHYGAEVIDRPADISGDSASSESALLHSLDYLERSENYNPNLLVFLQCTSPLTIPEDIDGAVESLLRENADTALAVTDFHYFLWTKDEAGRAVGINHDKKKRLLRQDRENQFLETGAVYIMRVSQFKKKKHRFFGKTAMYVIPRERCLEIDDPVDLQIAEVLIRQYRKQLRESALPKDISALILDFDGVFTDNKVIVMQDGCEAVVCNRGDGMGLSRLKSLKIPVLVLSSEENPVVQARCDKLGIKCLQGLTDKVITLRKWVKNNRLNLKNVVYVGNDVNDLSCMKEVGCSVAVGDAFPEARAASKIVLSSKGGNGAIREISTLIENQIREGGL